MGHHCPFAYWHTDTFDAYKHMALNSQHSTAQQTPIINKQTSQYTSWRYRLFVLVRSTQKRCPNNKETDKKERTNVWGGGLFPCRAPNPATKFHQSCNKVSPILQQSLTNPATKLSPILQQSFTLFLVSWYIFAADFTCNVVSIAESLTFTTDLAPFPQARTREELQTNGRPKCMHDQIKQSGLGSA